MTTNPTILESDFKYIDKNGNLMKTRTELTISQMLDFLNIKYQYNYKLEISGKTVNVDFKTDNGLIEVIENEDDIKKYKDIK